MSNKDLDCFKEKSDSNWELGVRCRDSSLCDAAANRFYYSLYQAVRCWGEKKGKSDVKDHVGKTHTVCTTWLKETSELSFDAYVIYSRLQGLREKGDYEPAPVKRKEIDKLYSKAHSLRLALLESLTDS